MGRETELADATMSLRHVTDSDLNGTKSRSILVLYDGIILQTATASAGISYEG